MKLNPFSKKDKEKKLSGPEATKKAEELLGGEMPEISDEMLDQMIDGDMPGAPKMNMMQKMALKRLKKMDPAKRKEVFAQAMGKMQDKAGGESKEEMAEQIEKMREAGQLNRQQYRAAKKRLGIK